MTEENHSVDAPDEYESRLVCFIDLLGFKKKVIQAQTVPNIIRELYQSINAVQASELRGAIYGQIPYLAPNGDFIRAADDPKIFAEIQTRWPMSVTQFSDSFVISCPASNKISCGLVIQLVYGLYRIFFKELGVLVRGGVEVGPLIHIENGPLFGPAMNQAYALESEVAVYPRLVFSDLAYDHLKDADPQSSYINSIFKDMDGLYVANLVTMALDAPSPEDYGFDELDRGLKELELAAIAEGVKVKSKVAYLRSALQTHKC